MLSRAAAISTIDCRIDRHQQWTVVSRMMGRAGVGVDNRVQFRMHLPNEHVTMDGRKATVKPPPNVQIPHFLNF